MKTERGSVILEFALASTVLVSILAGTFQFGYTFYVYNLLETAAGSGARYASLRTYQAQSATDVAKVRAAIKNMVVYGNPAGGTRAVAPGLKPDNVDVAFDFDDGGKPSNVRISINAFTVNAIFASYSFQGKPRVTFPYTGRYAPDESAP